MSTTFCRSGCAATSFARHTLLQHAQVPLATLCFIFRTQGGIFTTPGEAYTTPVEMWVKAFGEYVSRKYFFVFIARTRSFSRFGLVAFGYSRESTLLDRLLLKLPTPQRYVVVGYVFVSV